MVRVGAEPKDSAGLCILENTIQNIQNPKIEKMEKRSLAVCSSDIEIVLTHVNQEKRLPLVSQPW